MIFYSIVKIISYVILAIFLVLAIVMIAGRGDGLARLIANGISKTERYDVDRVTHALLFLSIVFVVLEIANLIFINTITVPCICIVLAAAAGYAAYKYIISSGVMQRTLLIEDEGVLKKGLNIFKKKKGDE